MQICGSGLARESVISVSGDVGYENVFASKPAPTGFVQFPGDSQAEKNLNSCVHRTSASSRSQTAKIPLTPSSRRQRRRCCAYRTYPRLSRQKHRTCRYF
ncbi:hypothetical protein C3E98_009845 [Pseudomonas sp. MWU13-2625]|nr:hypothetical protein C3E98_009845 [Pseudomonas sp. MWU13-2625]